MYFLVPKRDILGQNKTLKNHVLKNIQISQEQFPVVKRALTKRICCIEHNLCSTQHTRQPFKNGFLTLSN